jgi:hypothetical protein
MQRLLKSAAATSAPTKSKPQKSVDIWLGLFGAAVGIVFWLLEKTPVVIVASLVLIFALLFHPIWHFWWIERSLMRRASSVTALVVLLIVIGASVWPKSSSISNAQLCSDTKAFAQRMRDFDRERWRQFDRERDRFQQIHSKAKTEEERARIGRERNEYHERWFSRYSNDFADTYLVQAKYLRDELLSRLPSEPKRGFYDGPFSGILAGARPVSDAADRLEILAKKLCP